MPWIYNLLSNNFPFDLDGLSQYEMEQIILESDPPNPSAKTSAPFKKQLKGNLDAIVLKAIRKEPQQRYRTANEFWDDLDNFQQGLPIRTRDNSLKYRTEKFFKRNRQELAIALGAFLLMIGFAGFYTWRIAEERNQAQLEAEKAEEVTKFLVNLFHHSNPYFEEIQGGLNVKIGSVLEYGTSKIDDELSGQPAIQAELKNVIGEVYYQLGEFSKAESLLQDALDIRHSLYTKPEIETAETMRTLALLYQEKSNFNKAESLLTKALPTFEMDEKGLLNQDALSAMNLLGNLLWFNKGNYEAADSVLKRTLSLRRKMHEGDHLHVAKVLNDLATLYHAQGQYDVAKPYYRESIRMYERLFDKHANLAIIMSNFSALLRESGNYEEAERFQRDALTMHREINGKQSIDIA